MEYIIGRGAGRGAEQPHVGLLLGGSVRFFEYLQGALIAMDYRSLQELVFHAPMNERKPFFMDRHHPVCHILPRDLKPQVLEVGLQPIQGQGVHVLAVENVGDKRSRRKRALDRELGALRSLELCGNRAVLCILSRAGFEDIYIE